MPDPSLDHQDPEPAAVLHVCTTCLAGEAASPDRPRPGRVLHDRLAELAPATLRVEGVECLAVCAQGCGAAISMPGRWSYLIGRLAPHKAEDILVFADAYRRSRTGTVMPSRRPASLADMVLGRIPSPLPGAAA